VEGGAKGESLIHTCTTQCTRTRTHNAPTRPHAHMHTRPMHTPPQARKGNHRTTCHATRPCHQASPLLSSLLLSSHLLVSYRISSNLLALAPPRSSCTYRTSSKDHSEFRLKRSPSLVRTRPPGVVMRRDAWGGQGWRGTRSEAVARRAWGESCWV
jgi:hypothetical protein